MSHGFTGQKTSRRKTTAGKFSQASMRNAVTAYDQHDRTWHMNVEKSTGMPTGLISPNFSAPWLPEQQFLKINPDDPTELYIDYPQMYVERKAAYDKYHAEAVQKATVNGWKVPERGDYHERIVTTIGRPPSPVQPVVAAEQENGWILGFRDDPTTPADKMLAERWVLDTRRVSAAKREMDTLFDFRDGARKRGSTGPAAVAPSAESFEQLRGARIDRSADDPELADLELGDADLDPETRAALGEIERSAAGGDDLLDGVDDEPDADEAARQEAERLERLLDLQDQVDPDATGGTRVSPEQQGREARSQTPRRPKPQPQAQGGGRARRGAPRAFDRTAGRSLADGAKPVVSE